MRYLILFLIVTSSLFCRCEAKKETIDYNSLNYEQGVNLHKLGELEKSVNYLSNNLAVNPVDLPSLIKLSSIYLDLAKPASAISLLNRASKLSPDDAHIYLLLGKAYEMDKKLTNAISSYEQAIKLEPENILIRASIGYACYLSNDYNCAVRNLGNVVLAYPDDLSARIALGAAYHALKQHGLAKEQYKYVLSKDPSNYDVLYNLAKVHLALDEKNKAKENLDRAISLNDSIVDLYLDRAKVSYELSRLVDAESDYLIAIKLEPINPEIPVEYAKFLWETGAYLKAADMYARAIDLQPGDEEFITKRAYLLHLAGELDKAKDMWEELLTQNDKNTLALYNLGKLHEQKKEFDKAIKYYRKVSFIEQDVEAQKGLAFCLNQTKQYSEARLVYEEILKDKPDDASTHFNLGLLYLEEKNHLKAVNHLEYAISYNFSPLTDVYKTLINVYKKVNDNVNLALAYKKLLDMEKNNVEVRIEYAKYLRGLNNIQEALNQFLMAVAFDSTGKSRLELAKFLVNQNDQFGAVGQLQEYLKKRPKDLVALNLLADTYQKLKIPEQAINAYKKIITIQSDNYLAYYNLGIAYEQIEKHDEAENYLLKAIEIKEGFSPAYYALGLAYFAQDKKEQAKEMFEKYLSIDPNGEFKDNIETKLDELEGSSVASQPPTV